ncbi:MAG: histidinol-phosphate transaminase [Limnochordaceae bacterium]|nr:histidinol-phosphate transaminase [Limnochordaceae bacterium]
MWAVRGAVTVQANERETILARAEELTRALLRENDLTTERVVAGFYTATSDLNAAYPAEGGRRAGLTQSALLSAQEVAVPGGLPRCLRVLLLVEGDPPARGIQPVYLGEAQCLRPDWTMPDSRATASPEGPKPRPGVTRIAPYVPGKPIEEVQRELGLTDVIKLASNENPFGPSPLAQAAIRQAADQVHLYPDGNAYRLRQALADHLQRELEAQRSSPASDAVDGSDGKSSSSAPVVPAQIMVSNGSDEMIKMLAETFVNPGDRVVYGTPSFSEYEFACRVAAGEPVAVPLRDFHFDLEAVAQAAAQPRTRLVYICNPNNPTGTLTPRAELERLLARLRPETILILDEAYHEFVDDPQYSPGLMWAVEGRPVFVLRTFSKIYGLAGIRLGYAVGPADLVRWVMRVREPFNVNSLAQVAGLAALKDQEHVRVSRELVLTERRRLAQELSRRGLMVVPSQANFVYVDIGRPCRPVFEALLREGVIVRTGDIFGNETFLRVSIGLPEQNDRFLSALDRILAAKE